MTALNKYIGTEICLKKANPKPTTMARAKGNDLIGLNEFTAILYFI